MGWSHTFPNLDTVDGLLSLFSWISCHNACHLLVMLIERRSTMDNWDCILDLYNATLDILLYNLNLRHWTVPGQDICKTCVTWHSTPQLFGIFLYSSGSRYLNDLHISSNLIIRQMYLPLTLHLLDRWIDRLMEAGMDKESLCMWATSAF